MVDVFSEASIIIFVEITVVPDSFTSTSIVEPVGAVKTVAFSPVSVPAQGILK